MVDSAEHLDLIERAAPGPAAPIRVAWRSTPASTWPAAG